MEQQDRPLQLMQLISRCHLCFQLYTIDQTIDYQEFRTRLDADTVDYQQVLTDYADILERWADPDTSTLYIQRVIDLLNSGGA